MFFKVCKTVPIRPKHLSSSQIYGMGKVLKIRGNDFEKTPRKGNKQNP